MSRLLHSIRKWDVASNRPSELSRRLSFCCPNNVAPEAAQAVRRGEVEAEEATEERLACGSAAKAPAAAAASEVAPSHAAAPRRTDTHTSGHLLAGACAAKLQDMVEQLRPNDPSSSSSSSA